MILLMPNSQVKKGATLELEITRAAFEGRAVARVDGFVIFVRNAVPGDRVLALIERKRRKYAEAIVTEVVEPSSIRTEPPCAYFDTCGGCTWQNVTYEAQLDFKRAQVRELLARIGGLEVGPVAPVIPSPQQYDYRNKMEFSFGSHRWFTRQEIDSGEELDRGFALGLHVPKRFDRVLDVNECHLMGQLTSQLLATVRLLAREEGWSAYDSRKHQGFLRNLVVRRGTRTGQYLVNLVTSRSSPSRMKLFLNRLGSIPEVVTILNTVNHTRAPVSRGEETILKGSGVIEERLGELLIKVSSGTFLQPNTLQAENLYSTASKMAKLSGRETVFDLYSGVGCIALWLAPECKRVLGVEAQPEAVADAEQNAGINGIENCSFRNVDAAQGLDPALVSEFGKPHVVVLDPPRVGLDAALVSSLLEQRPHRVVYISCNPATQARDLAQLSSGYRIEAIQPVDMFPHTQHIECVVGLVTR